MAGHQSGDVVLCASVCDILAVVGSGEQVGGAAVPFIELAISLPFELLLLVVACSLTAAAATAAVAVALAFVLLPLTAIFYFLEVGERLSAGKGCQQQSLQHSVAQLSAAQFLLSVFCFSFSARSARKMIRTYNCFCCAPTHTHTHTFSPWHAHRPPFILHSFLPPARGTVLAAR